MSDPKDKHTGYARALQSEIQLSYNRFFGCEYVIYTFESATRRTTNLVY